MIFNHQSKIKCIALMAELVDALVSGTSGRKAVQVRSLFRAQKLYFSMNVEHASESEIKNLI